MANSGFSAAKSYFGTITGLTPKESSDGMTGSVATATNDIGDVIAHDVYGQRSAPSTTYAVTDDVAISTLPALGTIVSSGTGQSATKLMVTQIAINSTAGQPTTVTISGNQVHSTAETKRTYALPSGTIYAKCKAQEPCGAFSAPASGATWAFNSVTTTFSVDFVNQTKAGEIIACCPSNGRAEVQVTATDAGGSASITAASGWTVVTPASTTCPDEAYISISASAQKWLAGTDSSNGGGGSDD